MARSHSTDSEDNYVPMNPGSSPLIHTEKANDNAQNLYIPMSPGPHHFDLVGLSSATLPVHKGGAMAQCHRRLSEIQPPPVNRNLKPDRKGKNSCLRANLSRNPSVLVRLQTTSVILRTHNRILCEVCFATASTVRPFGSSPSPSSFRTTMVQMQLSWCLKSPSQAHPGLYRRCMPQAGSHPLCLHPSLRSTPKFLCCIQMTQISPTVSYWLALGNSSVRALTASSKSLPKPLPDRSPRRC